MKSDDQRQDGIFGRLGRHRESIRCSTRLRQPSLVPLGHRRDELRMESNRMASRECGKSERERRVTAHQARIHFGRLTLTEG